MPETRYGEVVFDKYGYAAGVIWQISSDKCGEYGIGWRVKTFGSLTDLVNSRDEAIKWFIDRGLI